LFRAKPYLDSFDSLQKVHEERNSLLQTRERYQHLDGLLDDLLHELEQRESERNEDVGLRLIAANVGHLACGQTSHSAATAAPGAAKERALVDMMS
jgi:hypothetical protein